MKGTLREKFFETIRNKRRTAMKWRVTFAHPCMPRGKLGDGKITWEISANREGAFIGIEEACEIIGKKYGWTRQLGHVITEAVLVFDDDMPIGQVVVPNTVIHLSFDPAAIKNRKFQRVWKDGLARTIWLAVKYRHLTNQHFNMECLEAAKWIRVRKPQTATDLECLMRMAMPHNARGINEPFWTQLLPCVLGQRQIGYVFQK